MPSPPDLPPESAPPSSVRRPIRMWPVVIILLLSTAAAIWVRLYYGRSHQDQNVAIAEIAIIAGLLLLLWCLLFSRLKWGIRLSALGIVVGGIVLLPLLFRIRGVTGDLVPILEWRWHQRILSSRPGNRAVTPFNAVMSQLTNDYPQFLGPNRDGILDHPRLARDWKAHPPKRLWIQPVGTAWSGFAVVGNRAITQEQRGEEETVICYDLLSGAMLWSHRYVAHFQSSLAGEGPRATPTIVGEKRVYALGSTGILNCLDMETGKVLWTKDILRDNQAQVSEWGASCSPLVIDDKVVLSAGGRDNRSLVAYSALTGEFLWGAGTEGAGYSSPMPATLAGTRQILIFNSGGVAAHDLTDGHIFWKYHWPGGHPHVSTPIILPDDRVLISSGYGVGSELIQIKKDSNGEFSANRIWKSNRLKAKFTNLVYRDGFIYGLDDGIMVCLEAATGELKWKEGRYGHGQEILVGDSLLVSAESGEVILLDPAPQCARELTRFTALTSKTWNPPAVAGEYLLVRNDKEAACYRLPLLTR